MNELKQHPDKYMPFFKYNIYWGDELEEENALNASSRICESYKEWYC